VAENCDGTGKTCPADAVEPATHECRAKTGDCDVAENCDGTAKTCPADAVQPATHECRAATGDCDVAENCDGTAKTCPADVVEPATHECRAATGDCDVAENCDGTAKTCPADVVQPATHECRAKTGDCDVAENCDGTGKTCPADAKSMAQCRPGAGVCDVAELCDGSSNDCPPDTKSTAVCRTSKGDCDPAETCDGLSNACPPDAKSTALCRPAAGECDVAERCDGVSNACPAETFGSAETSCMDTDGLSCTTARCDGAGACDQRAAEDCTVEICRSAGFWGNFECPGGQLTCNSGKSKNITQALINYAGGCIKVCGEIIRTTRLDDADSAAEAMCVSPQSNPRLQLVRQLTATALNCIMSSGHADCTGVSTEGVFQTCDQSCASGDASSFALCTAALDCLNNGGMFDVRKGSCRVRPGNCHERPLTNTKLGLNFEPTGSSGGNAQCSSAAANPCTVVPPGETRCTLGVKSPGPEACP
jgi:hypothetical protein